MGGGELKFFNKKLRLFRAVCIFLFLFPLIITPVFAQSGAQASVGQEAEADTIQSAEEPDPILAAERALPLGVPAPAGDEQTPARAPSSTFAIFRMLLVLVLAAAAIYGVVYIFKRASRRSEVIDPFLKVLASAHLGSGRYAHVVSLGSKAWLVGAAEGGVNLISEIDDKDILDALFLEDSRRSAEAGPGRFPDFKSMLRRLGMPVQSVTPTAENIRKRRERLKGL